MAVLTSPCQPGALLYVLVTQAWHNVEDFACWTALLSDRLASAGSIWHMQFRVRMEGSLIDKLETS